MKMGVTLAMATRLLVAHYLADDVVGFIFDSFISKDSTALLWRSIRLEFPRISWMYSPIDTDAHTHETSDLGWLIKRV